MGEGTKLIYVAGPYRGDNEWAVRQNIEASARMAAGVWKLNSSGMGLVMPVAPCLNSAHMGGLVPDPVFLECDLELLRRCDAMIMADGWKESSGVRNEIRFARERNLPIFQSLDSLRDFLNDPASLRRKYSRQGCETRTPRRRCMSLCGDQS